MRLSGPCSKMIVFRLRNMTEPSPVVKNDNLKELLVTSFLVLKYQ